MNKAFEKDNYLVPLMEQILEKVSRVKMFSFLYGLSGYNQVLFTPSDQLKNSFRTILGTFSYRRIPFGLINVGATFQRDMDIAFIGLMHNFVVVDIDDITIYSIWRHDHFFILNMCLKDPGSTESL